MTIANLPMYDLPEIRHATDDWWSGLARAFRRAGISDVPDRLDRERAMPEVWRDPGLVLSQACGYPLLHDLAGVVQMVATPVYTLAGCEGPLYRSVFVVRADDPAEALSDLQGRRVAVNSKTSQSGYNCLRHALAPLAAAGTMFSEVVTSGGHGGSLAAVQEARADLAAIDCVTYGLMARHQPAAVAGLRVLGESEPAPGLPYVTRGGADDALLARLREGLQQAVGDPDLDAARSVLGLAGVELLPLSAYRVIDDMEAAATAAGYPDVA